MPWARRANRRPSCGPPLIALLEQDTIPVTFWVADALTEIGTPEAKEAVAAWEARMEAWEVGMGL
jgi:hypothetical protein